MGAGIGAPGFGARRKRPVTVEHFIGPSGSAKMAFYCGTLASMPD